MVLTFRATAMLGHVRREAGSRFFHAEWGTRWGTKVIGLTLGARVDWREVKTLLAESCRAVAPRTLVRALSA